MNYPEKCLSLFGKLLGHKFADRNYGDTGYCCKRCGLVVNVPINEEIILKQIEAHKAVRIAQIESNPPSIIIHNYQPNGLYGLHRVNRGSEIPNVSSSLRWIEGGNEEAGSSITYSVC